MDLIHTQQMIDKALSKDTPAEELIALSKHPDAAVRYYVAGNQNTPVEILRILAQEERWGIKHVLTGNPSTPNDVLIQLYLMDNKHIKKAAGRF